MFTRRGPQPRKTKISALLMSIGVPQELNEELSSFFMLATHFIQWAVGITACLVALLYVTSMFEALLSSASGLVVGQSVTVAAITGLVVGTLHTVAGPDHLAGLAPLVVGQRRSAATAFALGALWGSGHAAGQAIIGAACLAVHVGLLRFAFESVALGQLQGVLVGASLVVIGLLGLHEAKEYEEQVCAQPERAAQGRRRFGWATFATGVVHGLSPDALIFIAPALALPRLAAAFHVAGVVAGTLLSMGACTALLGALCSRHPRLKRISTVASSVAMLLGVCLAAASFGVSFPLPGLG